MAPDHELRRHLDRRDLESAVSEVHLSEVAFSVGLTFNSPVAASCVVVGLYGDLFVPTLGGPVERRSGLAVTDPSEGLAES